jgi:hypothetical protein
VELRALFVPLLNGITILGQWDPFQVRFRNSERRPPARAVTGYGAPIWQDDTFKMLEASDIVAETTTSLEPMDDLAVVVLFSVFESQVRDDLAARMKDEANALTDPILKEAAADALQGVEEGSFFLRVLSPLKSQRRVPAGLVTEVNQVRDYRYWVAHGSREQEAVVNSVTPRVACERLKEFLAIRGIASESKRIEPQELEESLE